MSFSFLPCDVSDCLSLKYEADQNRPSVTAATREFMSRLYNARPNWLGKVIGGIVVVGVAILAIIYFGGSSASDNTLRASGTIEATNVDVAFEIPGRVNELLAVEGKPVNQGEILARLSAEERSEYVKQVQASLEIASRQIKQQELTLSLRREVLEQQVTQAQGQVEALASAAQKQRVGSRPQEIKVAEAALAQAEAILTERKSDYSRISDLTKKDVLSQAELDTATAQLRSAETNRDAAIERLALAKEGLVRESPEAQARRNRPRRGVVIAESSRKEADIQAEVVAAARAKEKELAAQLESAKRMLEHAEIRSPLSGVVLTKNVEAGEFVSPGTPVVTIADIDNSG